MVSRLGVDRARLIGMLYIGLARGIVKGRPSGPLTANSQRLCTKILQDPDDAVSASSSPLLAAPGCPVQHVSARPHTP